MASVPNHGAATVAAMAPKGAGGRPVPPDAEAMHGGPRGNRGACPPPAPGDVAARVDRLRGGSERSGRRTASGDMEKRISEQGGEDR